MDWIRQLTQTEPLRRNAKNHQLFEIRRNAMRFAGDSAEHLRDLIAAALLLKALTADPDDYSGLDIIVQTDSPRRFERRIIRTDRVLVMHCETGARAGLGLHRLKPEFVALVRKRVTGFERLPEGVVRRPDEESPGEIERLRREAANLFGDLEPSRAFRNNAMLSGRHSRKAAFA